MDGYLSLATLRRILGQTDNCAVNAVGVSEDHRVPSNSNAKPETPGPRCEQPRDHFPSATIRALRFE
jgi:hypothetical protein